MRSPERSAIITTDEERFWIRYHEERALFSFRLDDDTELRLKLNRVEIRCATGNKRSRAIPERPGFTQEETVRQAEWLYDRFVDHTVYGMLASEWQN